MDKFKFTAIVALVLATAGCLDNDSERALAGAAGGAVVAGSLGGNAVAGAAVGAAAGALCDDAKLCK